MCLPKTYVSINITLTHWRLISTLHSWLCLMSKQLYAAVTVCTACWLASRTRNPKVAGSSLRSGRYCRWGNWMYSALSSFNTTTEVPLSKAPNPQLLPGRRSINGCPLLRVCVHGVCVFTAVCVHFGWDKCRAQIPSMGYHTWPHVTSLSLFHVTFTFFHLLK